MCRAASQPKGIKQTLLYLATWLMPSSRTLHLLNEQANKAYSYYSILIR